MRKLTKRRKKKKNKNRIKIQGEYSNLFDNVDVEEGDESMSILPWKGEIKEPLNHDPLLKSAPDVNYKLQVAYGVRIEETRENVHFNYKGKIVYMTAALGVINDHVNRKQTFFGGGQVPMEAKNVAKDMCSHTDDIMCLILNKKRKLACSGQVGHKPFLYIWDSETGEMRTRARLEAGSRGVTSVTFSPNDSFVACVDATDDYNIIIFRVVDGLQVYKFKTGCKILDIAWGITAYGNEVIGAAGVKKSIFLVADKNNFDNTRAASGVVKAAYQTDYASVDFTDDGFCLLGTKKGKIYKMKHDSQTFSFKSSTKGHKKVINAINV
jgi:hypothetical protein